MDQIADTKIVFKMLALICCPSPYLETDMNATSQLEETPLMKEDTSPGENCLD